jgi:hypothetical protein
MLPEQCPEPVEGLADYEVSRPGRIIISFAINNLALQLLSENSRQDLCRLFFINIDREFFCGWLKPHLVIKV